MKQKFEQHFLMQEVTFEFFVQQRNLPKLLLLQKLGKNLMFFWSIYHLHVVQVLEFDLSLPIYFIIAQTICKCNKFVSI
jgi:hypothetical protein